MLKEQPELGYQYSIRGAGKVIWPEKSFRVENILHSLKNALITSRKVRKASPPLVLKGVDRDGTGIIGERWVTRTRHKWGQCWRPHDMHNGLGLVLAGHFVGLRGWKRVV